MSNDTDPGEKFEHFLEKVRCWTFAKGVQLAEFQVQLLEAMDNSLRQMVLECLVFMEVYLDLNAKMQTIIAERVLDEGTIRQWILNTEDQYDTEGKNLTGLYKIAKADYRRYRRRFFSLTMKMRLAGSTPALEAKNKTLNDIRTSMREAKVRERQYLRVAWQTATKRPLEHVPGAGWFVCSGGDWEADLELLPKLVAVRAFLDTIGMVEGQISFTTHSLREDHAETIADPLNTLDSEERQHENQWMMGREHMSFFDLNAWKQRQEGGPFPAVAESFGYAGDTSEEVDFGYGVSGREMDRVLRNAVRAPSPKKGMEDELIDFTFVELWTGQLGKPTLTKTYHNNRTGQENTIVYENLCAIMARDVPLYMKDADGRPMIDPKTGEKIYGKTYLQAYNRQPMRPSDMWPGKTWWAEVASVGHSGDARPNMRRTGSQLWVHNPKKKIVPDWATIFSTRFIDPSTFFDWMLYAAYKLAGEERMGLDIKATLANRKVNPGILALSNRAYVMLEDYGQVWVRYMVKRVQIGSFAPVEEAWMVMPIEPLKAHFQCGSTIKYVAVKFGSVATKAVQHLLRGHKNLSQATLDTLNKVPTTKKEKKIRRNLLHSLNLRESDDRQLKPKPPRGQGMTKAMIELMAWATSRTFKV